MNSRKVALISKSPRQNSPHFRPLHLLLRVAPIIIVIAAVVSGIVLTSSASAPKKVAAKAVPAAAAVNYKRTQATLPTLSLREAMATPFVPFFQTQSIDTFAANCSTPKSSYNLGQTVCAEVSGATLGFSRLFWGDPTFHVVRVTPITSDPMSDSFAPTITGTWTLLVVSNDGIVRSRSTFLVSDAANPSAELSVASSPKSPTGNAGGPISFSIQITNSGPDTAANARITVPVPANTTFDSFTQSSGPGFVCATSNGSTICDINGLGLDESAEFTATYDIAGGTTPDTEIELTVTGSSVTSDPNPKNNETSSIAVVVPGAACSVGDAPDITVNNDISGGQAQGGAVVTYTTPTQTGACGSSQVTCSIPSGSFFPVGVTSVVCSSDESSNVSRFNVTVNDTSAPSITCPANITVEESSPGSGSAVVNLPAPNVVDNDPNVKVSYSPASGSTFTIADSPHTVTVTATDFGGQTASCTFTVTVVASICQLSCPGNIVVSESPEGSGSAVVNFATPGEAGTCGTVTYDVPSGSSFPLGTTTVTASSTTSNATCSFTVTVRAGGDIEAPVITCPTNIVQAAPANSCSANVTVTPATATDDSGSATVAGSRSDGQALNAPYPVGEVVITWTATDAAGNSSDCQQSVEVTENVPPTVTAPAPRTVFVNSACEDVEVPNFLAGLVASDNCTSAANLETSQSPAAETLVGVGSHTITIKVTDVSGNITQVTTTFNVVDNMPPTITAPPAVSTSTGAGATSCGTTISDATLGSAIASDNCPGVTVTRSPSGNSFPVGVTDVVWTATDGSGNTATAHQSVTVVDNTPPVISCPGNITVYLPLNSTATSMAVSYPAATATDNCAGPITIGYSTASGSVFPVGPTSVTATATDANGNSASCTFTVTVLYNFTGFFSPVNNPPILNSVIAGRAIPVKFSLSGNKGLSIFAVNNPYTVSLNCSSNDPGVDVTETVNAGGSSLDYSPDQYNYIWKTDSSWAGTCRQLIVTLNDGSVHTANFKFK